MILVINCGSSSVKYKLFKTPSLKVIKADIIECRGGSRTAPTQAVRQLFRGLSGQGIDIHKISAIGHRVVHGGESFRKPALINEKLIREIKKKIFLSPLHNPVNLEGILAARRILPKVKQLAVFDTAFYQNIPKYAYVYGLPLGFYTQYKIRRYGFHGTSHQYVAQKACEILKKPLKALKLITVHLGNGCSISAIDRGRCIDTSMGFTPLEGLIMGTRCGDIDPAVILYLVRKLKMSPAEVDRILNKRSGLLGISGISNDLRLIKKKKSPRAKLALQMFIYRIRKYIGAYINILGGADALIFTAGIAENNPDVVRAAARGLAFLKKKPKVLVIPTDEELMIARLVKEELC